MAKKKAAKKKAKKAPSITTKEEFFVTLSEPRIVHLGFLEARRTTLEGMKLFAELKEVRRAKMHEKAKLRRQVRLISSTIKKLKKSMPHVTIHEPRLPKPKATKKIKVPEVPKIVHHPRSELDRVESELADIERQIARLQ